MMLIQHSVKFWLALWTFIKMINLHKVRPDASILPVPTRSFVPEWRIDSKYKVDARFSVYTGTNKSSLKSAQTQYLSKKGCHFSLHGLSGSGCLFTTSLGAQQYERHHKNETTWGILLLYILVFSPSALCLCKITF